MQKQKKGKKKFVMLIALALAAVITLGATFAWMTAEDSVTNRLETALITDGSAVIKEVFVPPVDWREGQKITKQVSVANNGSSDVLARVHFEEVMNLIQKNQDGTSDPLNAIWKDGDSTVPQIFNTTAYTTGDWKDPSALTGPQLVVNGLPLNGDAILKVQRTDTPTESGQKRSYSFILYSKALEITDVDSDDYAFYNGKHQRVTADFDVQYSETGDDVVTISNIKYWAFPGRTVTDKKWLTEKPGNASNPLVLGDIENPITDTAKKILISYTNDAALVEAKPEDAAGAWWYDKSSGYFYYIGKIAAGTVSPNLMESLMLQNGAGDAYTGMIFNLTVKMEAIQNTEAAITATDGWNVSNTDLLDALKVYCI